jgi:anti-sigma regulatory factor (Ser/Thr protein kinase)
MGNGVAVAVAVEDGSQVGEARRVATAVAAEAGFDESVRNDIGIVATEAATNLIRHAGQGQLLVRPLHDPAPRGLELVSVDQGPGIRDLQASLADGYSSRGGMGGGFGAMRRLASEFAIWSAPAAGTALVCRFFLDGARSGIGGVPVLAGLAVPLRGETACGDGWAAVTARGTEAVLLADGLGHGPAAEDAASTAIRLFREHPGAAPAQLMELLHAGMRSTRGAAVAVATIDRRSRQIRFAGIGNISGVLVTGTSARSLVTHNGTLGHQMRKPQEFVYHWEPGTLLIMHSDGLASRWGLDR